jgi:hypothetical protein
VGDVITRLFSCASWRLTLRGSYDERIIAIFLKYASAHFAAMNRLKLYHPFLLPIVAPFDKEVHEMSKQLREATQLLSPFLHQARSQTASQGSDDDSITRWLLQHVEADRVDDDEYLTKLLLAYNITFVFSTAPTGNSIVNETAFRPDFCGLIRQEADSVLGAAGWQFKKISLRELTKLDSFCKETHRHCPTSACKYCSFLSLYFSAEHHGTLWLPSALTRPAANLFKKFHKTIALPNGTLLPKGTTFEVVIQPANLRNPRLDRPAEWIGLRYHDLRKEGNFSDKTRRENEWGAATRDDMSFGYGSHLCPGKA